MILSPRVFPGWRIVDDYEQVMEGDVWVCHNTAYTPSYANHNTPETGEECIVYGDDEDDTPETRGNFPNWILYRMCGPKRYPLNKFHSEAAPLP